MILRSQRAKRLSQRHPLLTRIVKRIPGLRRVGSAFARRRYHASVVHKARAEAADPAARLRDLTARFGESLPRSDAEPVFVFAAGWRSGSTLVQRWLMSGPDLLIWGEPYALAQPVQSLFSQFLAITPEWPMDDSFGLPEAGRFDDDWVANLYPEMGNLVRAHQEFFTTLFEKPARAAGRRRWGLKEVRLRSVHAAYLKILFPRARFLFLYRDPVPAYASFRDYIRTDFAAWPDRPVQTATDFGRMWSSMVEDFRANHEPLGAPFLKLEDLLSNARIRRDVGAYLDVDLEDIAELRVIRGIRKNQEPPPPLPPAERQQLDRQVARLRADLGYREGR